MVRKESHGYSSLGDDLVVVAAAGVVVVVVVVVGTVSDYQVDGDYHAFCCCLYD